MKKPTLKSKSQQARKRAKQERRQKRQSKKGSSSLRRNQHYIAKKLMAGKVPLVCATAWGYVDQLLSFMHLIGFFRVLDIEGDKFERKMVSVCQLLATYELKVILGIVSINQVGTKLFREKALLRLVGYTTQQLEDGICKRGYGDSKPMHSSTLAHAIERLSQAELDYLLQETVKCLVKRKFLWRSHGHYALDASDLPTSAKFKGRGKRTSYRRKKTKEGKMVEIPETVYGFKLLIVYEVKLRLVVAVKVVQIQSHESNYTLELAQQAQANLGSEYPIKVLLMDRGFLDGQTLWRLKHEMDIDWVIPVRRNMAVTEDARQLARQPVDNLYITQAHRPAKGLKGRGQVSLRGVKDLVTFDTYGDEAHQKKINTKAFQANPINALVVTRWRNKPHKPDKQPVFLTTLDISQPMRILDLYDFRSLIENTAFRELKQGWNLLRFPKRNPEAMRAHVYLTLLCFTVVNAFQSHQGQSLMNNGIRQQRLQSFEALLVMVIDDEAGCYAFFHLEELLTLLGHPPETCLAINPDEVLQGYAVA